MRELSVKAKKTVLKQLVFEKDYCYYYVRKFVNGQVLHC